MNFKVDSSRFWVELSRQNELNIAFIQRNVFATGLQIITCLNIIAIDSNVTSEFKISKFQDLNQGFQASGTNSGEKYMRIRGITSREIN